MGFNPLKMVRKALRSNSLLVKVTAAFLVFWLFGMMTSAVGLEGFTAGAKGDVMVYFHMNGCPHCTKFNPEWDKFSKSTSVQTKKVESKQMNAQEKQLGVDGFPTVMLLGPKGPKKYTGARTASALQQWVDSL